MTHPNVSSADQNCVIRRPDEARLRRGRVEDRTAEDERVGVRPRRLEEARHIVERVLTVGVDLHRVRTSEVARRQESGLHGSSLASVFRAKDGARQPLAAERLHDAPPLFGAPVVDHDDVVDVLARFDDDTAHRRRVVERRNEDAGAERRFGHR